MASSNDETSDIDNIKIEPDLEALFPVLSDWEIPIVSMEDNQSTLCLICCRHQNTSDGIRKLDQFPVGYPLLNRQLFSFFLIRRVLECTTEECAHILQNTSNYSDAECLILCDSCFTSALNAYQIGVQISGLTSQLETIKQGLNKTLQQTLRNENDIDPMLENRSAQWEIRNLLKHKLRNEAPDEINSPFPEQLISDVESDPEYRPYVKQPKKSTSNVRKGVKNEKQGTQSSSTRSRGVGARECDLCDFSSRFSSKMSEHRKLHRMATGKCDICNYPVMSKVGLKRHMSTKHGAQLDSEFIQDPGDDAYDNAGTSEIELVPSSIQALDSDKEKATLDDTSRVPKKYSAGGVRYVNNARRCEFCTFTTRFTSKMSQHRKLHRMATDKCSLCNYPVISALSLKRHMSTRHGITNQSPECQEPGDTADTVDTSKIDSIPTHVPFARSKRRKFTTKRTFRRKPMKKTYAGPGVEVTCLICSYSSRFSSKMSEHRKIHRLASNKCTLCDYPVLSEISLRRHMSSKHGITNPSLESFHFEKKTLLEKRTCSLCGFVAKFPMHLQGHMKQHELLDAHVTISGDGRQFTCNLCNWGCTARPAIITHLSRFHMDAINRDTLLCHLCEKSFCSEAGLQKHIRCAHEDKVPRQRRHTCEFCGKAYFKKFNLDEHRIKHLNGGKAHLVCDVCGLDFKSQNGLADHRRASHPHNLKGYKVTEKKCPHCGVSCVNLRHLKSHFKADHPELYKFKCELCDAKYISSGNLRIHVKVEHLKETEKCDKCGQLLKCFSMRQHKLCCKGPAAVNNDSD